MPAFFFRLPDSNPPCPTWQPSPGSHLLAALATESQISHTLGDKLETPGFGS